MLANQAIGLVRLAANLCKVADFDSLGRPILVDGPYFKLPHYKDSNIYATNGVVALRIRMKDHHFPLLDRAERVPPGMYEVLNSPLPELSFVRIAAPENNGEPILELGGTAFNRQYIEEIAKLPDARISVHKNDPFFPRFFMCAGGQGVIMPCGYSL